MILRATTIFLSTVLVLSSATRIDDPKNFVTDVYQHYIATQSTDHSYTAPSDIYTPRLDKLLRDDRRKAKGEVGCIDFDFWANGQDWRITNVTVASTDVGPDQKTVVAKFVSFGDPQEIQFDFRRIGGRWLLDDVHSRLGEKWTLSEILKCTY